MKSNILEVTFDTPEDGNVYFPPCGYSLRGRRDFMRMAMHQPDAVNLAAQFPRGLPSTLLRIDLDERAVTLVEPLRSDEWLPERESLEARQIPIPRDIEIPHPHISDWLHEVKRSLDFGRAKIVKGALPEDLGEESGKPRLSPDEKSESREEKLCDLIENLLATLAPLVKAATSK